jgi:hypothetical protein
MLFITRSVIFAESKEAAADAHREHLVGGRHLELAMLRTPTENKQCQSGQTSLADGTGTVEAGRGRGAYLCKAPSMMEPVNWMEPAPAATPDDPVPLANSSNSVDTPL